MVTLAAIDFLVSEGGRRLLDDLAHENLADSNTLPLLTRLRKIYSADEASSALTQARLRQKAVEKFGADARQMLFTADALQQASDPLIRQYRARMIEAPRIFDAGCGIGADSLAFTRAGHTVVGMDIDPVRVALAQHNAQVLGLGDNLRFEVGDVREVTPEARLIFFDPARRDENGKRIYDVQRYIPPLALIDHWAQSSVVVKLSPGVDLAQLEPYGGGIEFISVQGDLKEAVLWRDGGWSGYRATLINAPDDIHHFQRDEIADVGIDAPRAWLVEPDPALIRAGLVQDVAQLCDGAMLDETIAYFTTDSPPESVWVRAWRVQDWMPFHLKRLRAYLRAQDVGQVTVKKRGSPLTPESLIPKLKLKGTQHRTLVLTRYKTQPIVLICDLLPING